MKCFLLVWQILNTFIKQLQKRRKRNNRNMASAISAANQRETDLLDEDVMQITGQKEVIDLETGKINLCPFLGFRI